MPASGTSTTSEHSAHVLEQALSQAEILLTGQGDPPPVRKAGWDPGNVCRGLEEGGIVFFPQSPFILSEDDKAFLLGQRQTDAPIHKNVSYRPLSDKLHGAKTSSEAERERLRRILRGYSEQVTEFLQERMSPYRNHWQLDYASFRPLEEKGRKLRLRARNDLLHVDSFPTRPIEGDRILRVFTNLNPSVGRKWITSDHFETLARQFKSTVKPYRGTRRQAGAASRQATLPKLLRSMGLKGFARPAYDRWMLDFHNFLKENPEFQRNCPKNHWEFPPGSSWMVYTDMVSHAVLSGQYAIEQTFIIGRDGMVAPEKTPIRILENLYGIN